MDTKAVLNCKKKLNELAIGHNKLTTLVGCLLNEIQNLKKELHDSRGGDSSKTNSYSDYSSQQPSSSGRQSSARNPNKFPNFNELKAEEILQQLSINHVDN